MKRSRDWDDEDWSKDWSDNLGWPTDWSDKGWSSNWHAGGAYEGWSNASWEDGWQTQDGDGQWWHKNQGGPGQGYWPSANDEGTGWQATAVNNDEGFDSFEELLEHPEAFLAKETGTLAEPVQETGAAGSQKECGGEAKAAPFKEQATHKGPPDKNFDSELPEPSKDVATDANEVAAWQQQLVEILSRPPSSWTVAWWHSFGTLFI